MPGRGKYIQSCICQDKCIACARKRLKLLVAYILPKPCHPVCQLLHNHDSCHYCDLSFVMIGIEPHFMHVFNVCCSHISVACISADSSARHMFIALLPHCMD